MESKRRRWAVTGPSGRRHRKAGSESLYPGQSNGDEEEEAEAEAEDRNRGVEEAMAARVAAMAWLNERELDLHTKCEVG